MAVNGYVNNQNHITTDYAEDKLRDGSDKNDQGSPGTWRLRYDSNMTAVWKAK